MKIECGTKNPIKNVIIYIPWELKKIRSASQLRPLKIKEAFIDLGYAVHEITGDYKQRIKCFNELRRLFDNGVTFNYCYMESPSSSIFSANKKVLSLNVFFDYIALYFIKKKICQIGLFYRDIYWRFDYNKKNYIKSFLNYLFSLLDLFFFTTLCKVVFLPNFKMKIYMPNFMRRVNYVELPPACGSLSLQKVEEKLEGSSFNLVYVGGIGNQYNLWSLVRVVGKLNDFKLNLFVRECDYKNLKDEEVNLLSSSKNIRVFLDEAEQLEEYLRNSDLCVAFFKPSDYMKFAIPYKYYEYLSFGKPVLAARGTAIGDLVDKHGSGFEVEYNETALTDFFNQIILDPSVLRSKTNAIIDCAKSNSWEKRVLQIEKNILS